MSNVLTDAARLVLLDPICQGLNALKGNADEALYLRETIKHVTSCVERAKRNAQVVAMPDPRATRIRMLEVQMLVLQQELSALQQSDVDGSTGGFSTGEM